jgi:hypothetical protein
MEAFLGLGSIRDGLTFRANVASKVRNKGTEFADKLPCFLEKKRRKCSQTSQRAEHKHIIALYNSLDAPNPLSAVRSTVRRLSRPTFVKKGIVPEIAKGLGDAATVTP